MSGHDSRNGRRGATLSNTGTVTLNEVDGLIANNASTAIVGIGAAAGIPTLNAYGLMLLALALGLAGVVLVRRS
jgi:hypothetical protein